MAPSLGHRRVIGDVGMFQAWRVKVREAEEALRDGRLEEASRLLNERGLLEFLPAKRLMAKVAQEMAERAEKRFATGATMAGWQDLLAAEQLGGEHAEVARLKQQFVEAGMSEAEAYLKAGEPAAAMARLEALHRQGAGGREFRLVREAAAKVLAAQGHCQTGQFAKAEEEIAAALVLRPDWQVLAEIRKACLARGASVRRLVEQLHSALTKEDWTLGLAHAEAILEISPEHVAALDARRRAWAVVGACLSPSPAGVAAQLGIQRTPLGHAAQDAQMVAIEEEPSVGETPSPRFLLWVDGVGGYLVCQGDVVSLGQPVQGSYVDVPVLADISRLHAKIRRDGESYVIEPGRTTHVDGRAVDHATLLVDGSLIELGDGVKMRFRIPNPLSRTARLEFISHHRTLPRTDCVLLMAESCILGPGSTSHIVCRDWPQDVVLFPQGGTLHCRTAGRFEVDSVAVEDRTTITRSSQIVGEDFSLSLENV
jgi:hypothetical protein